MQRRVAALLLVLLALSGHALVPLEAAYAPGLLGADALPPSAPRSARSRLALVDAALVEQGATHRERVEARARAVVEDALAAAAGSEVRVAVVDDLLVAALVVSIVFGVVALRNSIAEKAALKNMRQTIQTLLDDFTHKTNQMIDALHVIAEETETMIRDVGRLLSEHHVEVDRLHGLIGAEDVRELVADLGDVSPEQLLHGQPAERAKSFLVRFFRKAKKVVSHSPAAHGTVAVGKSAAKAGVSSVAMPFVKSGIVWTLGQAGVVVSVAAVGAVFTFAGAALSVLGAVKSYGSLVNTRLKAGMMESIVRVHLDTHSLELQAAACPMFADMYDSMPDEGVREELHALLAAARKEHKTAPTAETEQESTRLLEALTTRVQLLHQGIKAQWVNHCSRHATRAKAVRSAADEGDEIVRVVVGEAGDANAMAAREECKFEAIKDQNGNAELNNEHHFFSRDATVHAAPQRQVDGENNGERREQSRALYVCRRRNLAEARRTDSEKASEDEAAPAPAGCNAVTDLTIAWGRLSEKNAKKLKKKGLDPAHKTKDDARNNRLTVEDLESAGYTQTQRYDKTRSPPLGDWNPVINEGGRTVKEDDLVLMYTHALKKAGRVNGLFLARGREQTPAAGCTVDLTTGFSVPNEADCPWRRVGGMLPLNFVPGHRAKSSDPYLWERKVVESRCPAGSESSWCYAAEAGTTSTASNTPTNSFFLDFLHRKSNSNSNSKTKSA